MLQPKYTMHGFNRFDPRGTEGVGFVRTLRTLLTNKIPGILPIVKREMVEDFSRIRAEHPVVDGTARLANRSDD